MANVSQTDAQKKKRQEEENIQDKPSERETPKPHLWHAAHHTSARRTRISI